MGTEHGKQHTINSTADHGAGTSSTLLGTDGGGALAELVFSQSAASSSIAQRQGNGNVTVPSTPAASTDAASKNYVDSVAAGINPVEAVSVKDAVGDEDNSGAPPALGPSDIGKTYVVNNWGGGFTDGDLVEWDGAAFQVIVPNSGGFVPNGTRIIVHETAPSGTGSFDGQEADIATADGIGGWTFTQPVDGDFAIVHGNGSVNENKGFTYDDTTLPGGTWIFFQGQVNHNDTNNIGVTTEGVAAPHHSSQAAAEEAEKFKTTVTGVSDPPTAAELAASLTATDQRCFATGSGKFWLAYRSGSNVYAVELGILPAGGA